MHIIYAARHGIAGFAHFDPISQTWTRVPTEKALESAKRAKATTKVSRESIGHFRTRVSAKEVPLWVPTPDEVTPDFVGGLKQDLKDSGLKIGPRIDLFLDGLPKLVDLIPDTTRLALEALGKSNYQVTRGPGYQMAEFGDSDSRLHLQNKGNELTVSPLHARRKLKTLLDEQDSLSTIISYDL